MQEVRLSRLDTGALAKAGAAVGVTLYVLCALFYWLFYGAQGQWMIRPFMPGLSTNAGGLLAGLIWSVVYGAGISCLFGFFYNRWVRSP